MLALSNGSRSRASRSDSGDQRCGWTADLVSDVHLPQRTPEERAHLLGGSKPPFTDGPPSDVLFLCGDVGSPLSSDYERFLRRLTGFYSLVLLVPGNHEYVWDGRSTRPDFQDVTSRLEEIQLRCGNLRVLDEGAKVELPGSTDGLKVVVSGATLWTNVAPRDDQALSEKLSRSYAWYRGRAFEPDDVRALHRAHIRGLRSSIREAASNGNEICLLTHHCPWGIPSKKMESVYVTDLPHTNPEMFLPPVKSWCYGHTHRPFDGQLGSTDCRLVSNPIGYPAERLPFDRRKRLCFALPPSKQSDSRTSSSQTSRSRIT
jgi:hypothetical protein